MWGMKQMMMQALNKEQHTLRSFNSEREARLASAMLRSQSVSIGVFQTPSAMLPVDSGSLGSFTRRPMHWLKDALEYVDRIDQEAREEGYPPIGHLAKKSAKRVLFIAGSSPIEPHVYASMDGEIALYFKSPVAPAALLILCDNKGSAGCYWSIHGNSEHRRHDDALELPIDFVLGQLRALEVSPLSQSFEYAHTSLSRD